jgi:hypothetical protein
MDRLALIAQMNDQETNSLAESAYILQNNSREGGQGRTILSI